MADLADQLDVAERTVQRAVARLADEGLLEVVRPRGGWRGVPNAYRLLACPTAEEQGRDDALCHHVHRSGNGSATRGDLS